MASKVPRQEPRPLGVTLADGTAGRRMEEERGEAGEAQLFLIDREGDRSGTGEWSRTRSPRSASAAEDSAAAMGKASRATRATVQAER